MFRSDIPCKFNLVPKAVQGLIDNIDADLEYAIRTDGKVEPSEAANYAENGRQKNNRLCSGTCL